MNKLTLESKSRIREASQEGDATVEEERIADLNKVGSNIMRNGSLLEMLQRRSQQDSLMEAVRCCLKREVESSISSGSRERTPGGPGQPPSHRRPS